MTKGYLEARGDLSDPIFHPHNCKLWRWWHAMHPLDILMSTYGVGLLVRFMHTM